MKRPILLHPDPRLKKASAPVADLTDELRTLADDMMEKLYGVPLDRGLAMWVAD
ncbi:MAG: peptide deformylase, partial [Pseudomonadota bacterium]